MRVAFRADASLKIGTGHVMRCLTLADALRDRGADCVFLSRSHEGHMHGTITARGYTLLDLGGSDPSLSQDSGYGYGQWLGVDMQVDAEETRNQLKGYSVDWLVVDHYGLDIRWEKMLRLSCARILAIDDLANREHAVDALLDQNLGKTRVDYETRVSHDCGLMIGPHYALLRPEFAALRAQSLSGRGHARMRKILITMGGVDSANATGQVLDTLAGWRRSFELEITVVLGLHAPWRDKVMAQARHMPYPTEVLVDVTNMGALMCAADLAIGAAGSTSWERCCLGLPSLQMVLAENQRSIATALCQVGAALLLECDRLMESLPQAMGQLADFPAKLGRMSEAAAQITDGLGARRVAKFICEREVETFP